MNNSVMKYLDASTGNLPQIEFERLDNRPHNIHTLKYDYGVWVHVEYDDQEKIEFIDKEYPALAKVLAFARAHECLWINFDQDAALVDGLPVWEWERIRVGVEIKTDCSDCHGRGWLHMNDSALPEETGVHIEACDCGVFTEDIIAAQEHSHDCKCRATWEDTKHPCGECGGAMEPVDIGDFRSPLEISMRCKNEKCGFTRKST
jgi:hypothetical protein